MENKSGTLFIVATPIGNLEDMTLRAIRVLKEADLIACEDTRVARKLLDHYDIKNTTISYFQHSKLSKIEYLISQLKAGKNIALITDAGTPGISDPGQELLAYIRKYHPYTPPNLGGEEEGIKIVPIPGASALTAAASVSGMIEKEFFFAGFLPKKKGRQTKFKELSKLNTPVVIYESANRLERTLGEIKEYFGAGREVFVAREITKMFEEYWGGTIEGVISQLSSHQLKGELVLMVNKNC